MPTQQTILYWLPTNNVERHSPYGGQWRQRGAASIEYALLSALIALVILGSVSSTGTAVFDLWTNIAAQISTAI